LFRPISATIRTLKRKVSLKIVPRRESVRVIVAQNLTTAFQQLLLDGAWQLSIRLARLNMSSGICHRSFQQPLAFEKPAFRPF
jgi:hypothetical protein